MKSVRLLFVTLIVSYSAMGQSLKDTVKLKDVYVTSSRQVAERAFYIKNIDSIVLVNSTQTNMSELLQKNSSLYIKSYGVGGLATASFRGTAASHTQVVWNGLNINSPLWGQTDLSLIPVFFTDEISLLYGSSSLAKTSGGLGGCISLNNTPSWDKGLEATLSQTIGSFEYLLSQLKLGYSNKKIASTTRFIYDKAKNDYRYYDNVSGIPGYTRQRNAEYDKEGFLQEIYYKLNSRQFAGIKVMSLWSDRNLPPLMSFLGINQYENQRDNYVNILGEWKYYGEKSKWSLNSGFIRSDINYILTSTNPEGTFVKFDTEGLSNIFSTKLNFQSNLSQKTVLKSSLDAVFTEAEYSDYKENSGFEVTRKDITLQTSLHRAFSQLLSGYLLAQQKVLDNSFLPLIAAAGLEYHIKRKSDIILRTNFGRNLHVPTLNDMYFKPGGNRNLKQEVGYQTDVGILWNREYNDISYQVELAGFAAWIQDWIIWRQSEYRYWIADNVQHVFSRGIEINATVNGSWGTIDYKLKGNYGFTRTTDEEKESDSYGNQLIYIPKHIGNVHLFLEKDKYTFVLSFHKTGARFASTVEDLTYRVPSYYLFDLVLGKTWQIKKHSLKMNFCLNNILNKQYQVIQYWAMPGRNFGLNLSFNL